MAFNHLPPKRTRPKMGIRESSIERSDAHLRWIRTFVCVAFESGECQGKTHAHHLRSAGTSGTGVKPGDFSAIPCCEFHHKWGHDHGWKTFSAKYNLDLTALSEKFARISPHRVRAA